MSTRDPYFPPLADCLDGGALLISWREVLAILDGSRGEYHEKLETFLQSAEVRRMLARPFDGYLKPNPQSKTAYEQATLPIHITPAADNRYDIKDIKEDALWLSKEVNIDEYAALRIVILEHQSRARNLLLGDFSVEETTSLQEACGNINTETSALVPKSSLPNSTSGTNISTNFSSQESRHARQLLQYLSERKHLLKCAQLLLYTTSEEQHRLPADQGAPIQWLVGNTLLDDIMHAKDGQWAFLNDCITSLKAIASGLAQGSGWMNEVVDRDELEFQWFHSQLVQLTITMELILWMIEINKGALPRHEVFPVCPKTVILSWFGFVSEQNFFADFESSVQLFRPLIDCVQALTAIISLSFIDPWSSSSFFDDRSTMPALDDDHPYILDIDCVAALNTILVEAAVVNNPVASPAVFAWSIVLREAHTTAAVRKETRELGQNQKALDGIERQPTTDDDADYREVLNEPSSRRRNSTSSEFSHETSFCDKVMDAIKGTELGDGLVEFLATSSVNTCQVIGILTRLAMTSAALTTTTQRKIRLTILDCIRCTTSFLGYIPEVVGAILAAMTGNEQFWDLCETVPAGDSPIRAFCMDDVLRQNILGMAISRYPYESLPFLRLIRVIASYQELSETEDSLMVFTWLGTLKSFTHEMPPDFMMYKTIHEEENANNIQLMQTIPLFESCDTRRFLYTERDLQEGPTFDKMSALGSREFFLLPLSTTGRIITDSEPKVVVWWHELSGLKYLGKLLETAIATSNLQDAITRQAVDRDSLIEIVGLFATLLQAGHNMARQGERVSVHKILEEASNGLSPNRDIVGVIFSIFEEELQRIAEGSSSQSLELLVNCVQFMSALMPILPGRIWPLLARSGLLDISGKGSSLTTILTNVELVSSRYDFLLSCVRLLETLVEDASTNAVVRKTKSRALTRLGAVPDPVTGVPNHVLSSVLLSFSRVVSEVFIAACNWKYVDINQRLMLSLLCSRVLERILHLAYCIDDLASPEARLTGSFAPAADYIIHNFLSSSSGHLRFQPFLRGLLDGLATPDSSLATHTSSIWLQHVKSVLELSTTLIRLSSLTGKTSTQLESQLYKATPLVVRLYAVHDAYQDPIVQLLDALVVNAATGDKEPPSLLGYLGAQTCKNFLAMLSDLGKPLDDGAHTISIWRLLTSVVSSRQQWFAIYLLTGKTPRASIGKLDTDNAATVATKPLLSVAFKTLEKIEDISPVLAIAMLEFVSRSQNFWPWAMNELFSNGNEASPFIVAISKHVSGFNPVTANMKLEECLRGAHQARIAALVAEVLAMYLFHMRQLGQSDKSVAFVLEHIGYYQRCGVAVPSYNNSLNGNLTKNFETAFPGCTLQNFKRTDLEVRERGRNYYYDLELASTMLSANQAWSGRKNDGLAEEFACANVNLTLVEAQVSVLNGWKMLVSELSNHTLKDREKQAGLDRVLARTASDCLSANNRAQLPDNIFTQLSQTRADLALILVQRLVSRKSAIPECLHLISKAWDTICLFDTSFESALASDDDRTILYLRTLLKITFLSLKPHATVAEEAVPQKSLSGSTSSRPAIVTARSGMILDIINKVVFHGFRDIARAIHELPGTSTPEDLALVTGILQASLSVPGLEFCHEQILNAASNADVSRVATTLFSWSDKLAIEGDPIYGQLSILFLLELSSVPSVAEQMALDGVLGQIASSGITNYLRRPNISPFSEGVGLQRCYNIWVRGILPLLLNILDAVGSAVACEIAIFLNQFSNLLGNSVNLIDTPSSSTSLSSKASPHMCLSTIQELSSIALIDYVLKKFRESMRGSIDVPLLKWDAGEVKESVEWWLSSRAVLRERIVPLADREVMWAKSKALDGNSTCKSRLEEMIVGELEDLRDVLGSE